MSSINSTCTSPSTRYILNLPKYLLLPSLLVDCYYVPFYLFHTLCNCTIFTILVFNTKIYTHLFEGGGRRGTFFFITIAQSRMLFIT